MELALVVGLVMGLRHAFEPDHVATVATLGHLYNRHVIAGALWSTGHASTILLVALLINFLGFDITKYAPVSFDMLVGIAMIVLGISTLKIFHIHPHFHTGKFHVHGHDKEHHEIYQHKPFAFGMLHGLAGSGAAMILFSSNLLFLSVFGVGTIISMIAMTIGLRTILLKISPQVVRTVVSAASIVIGSILVVGINLL